MKKMPIGISDYKQVIEGGYYYVDKTLLVKELFDRGGAVTLMPRPRRFGKTLNLSMLRYFFENTDESNVHLFEHAKIWQEEEYRKLHAKFPVIFISFRHVKEKTWEKALEKISDIIKKELVRHKETIESSSKKLTNEFFKQYEKVIAGSPSEVEVSSALELLSVMLSKATSSRVFVLIDEYDAPIHASYLYGYYEQMLSFVRSMLTGLLKDNSYLEKGVLTGILRTAKEGVFSGLNNLKVDTLLSKDFSDKFGFTESEVDQLLADSSLEKKKDEIKLWYNGYHFRNSLVYNPWSIINCIDSGGDVLAYWSNTSDNAIIKNLIAEADSDVKKELTSLLSDNILVEKDISEGVVFSDLEYDSSAVWGFLLFSGYLTAKEYRLEEGSHQCGLAVPNKEVAILYRKLIKLATREVLVSSKATQLLEALVTGNSDIFKALLQEFIFNSMSVHDVPSSDSERSYHLFVLGLLVLLENSYRVKSNRESGLGRYDIMLIPHNRNKPGIIIEFKKVWAGQKITLEDAAENALQQIKDKKYASDLQADGVSTIYFYGIAFQGKQMELIFEQE